MKSFLASLLNKGPMPMGPIGPMGFGSPSSASDSAEPRSFSEPEPLSTPGSKSHGGVHPSPKQPLIPSAKHAQAIFTDASSVLSLLLDHSYPLGKQIDMFVDNFQTSPENDPLTTLPKALNGAQAACAGMADMNKFTLIATLTAEVKSIVPQVNSRLERLQVLQSERSNRREEARQALVNARRQLQQDTQFARQELERIHNSRLDALHAKLPNYTPKAGGSPSTQPEPTPAASEPAVLEVAADLKPSDAPIEPSPRKSSRSSRKGSGDRKSSGSGRQSRKTSGAARSRSNSNVSSDGEMAELRELHSSLTGLLSTKLPTSNTLEEEDVIDENEGDEGDDEDQDLRKQDEDMERSAREHAEKVRKMEEFKAKIQQLSFK